MIVLAQRVPETMDKKRTPEVHPKPYESPLWQHLETIRSLRRQRKTWAAIAVHLEESHGLKTSLRTVPADSRPKQDARRTKKANAG